MTDALAAEDRLADSQETGSAIDTGTDQPGSAQESRLALRRWGIVLSTLVLLAAGLAAWVSNRHEQDALANYGTDRVVLADVNESLPAILGYDYRRLETDIERALLGLTPRFARDYEDLFQKTITPTARKYRGVVSAEVVAAGVESASDGRAQVLAFVNQTTTTKVLPAPRVDSSRVRVKLKLVGGHWLIDAVDPL